MAYDESLARRVRDLLANESDVVEQRMFGGLAFLLAGNMAVAVGEHGGVMLRCDPAEAETLLADPHASPMEMRGREMTGWIQVANASGLEGHELARWITVGVRRASNLPAK